MSKSLILGLTLVVAMLMIGCAKSESTTNSATTPTTTKPAASPAATTATTASADSIGVPECDAFITKYEACVKDKVPEAARTQFNSTLAQWRKSWKQLAENPQTKATLASACKQSMETARTSMKAYNCTF